MSYLDITEDTWDVTYCARYNTVVSPQAKTQKLSGTPIKSGNSASQRLDFQCDLDETVGFVDDDIETLHDTKCDMLCASLAHMYVGDKALMRELISIFPEVAMNLQSEWKMQMWGVLLKLVKEGTFPLFIFR